MNGKWKPGQSGNPEGRPMGRKNKNQNPTRQMIHDIIDTVYTTESLKKDLKRLEPKERVNIFLRLAEFVAPRLKSIEASIDQQDLDEPLFNPGLLDPEERKIWYSLYDRACGKTNGQAEAKDVEPVKT